MARSASDLISVAYYSYGFAFVMTLLSGLTFYVILLPFYQFHALFILMFIAYAAILTSAIFALSRCIFPGVSGFYISCAIASLAGTWIFYDSNSNWISSENAFFAWTAYFCFYLITLSFFFVGRRINLCLNN